MRHFSYLSEVRLGEIFYELPQEINLESEKDQISLALGGTLYIPANRKDTTTMIIQRKFPTLSSVVFCLEDSISNLDYENAKLNLLESLIEIKNYVKEGSVLEKNLPFMFIRVRNNKTLDFFIENSDALLYICGVVLPKAGYNNLFEVLSKIEIIEKEINRVFYVMPILESKKLIYSESRYIEFNSIKLLFKNYNKNILCLRIGVTDLCSLYSIRRKFNSSIYDIAVVNSFISDVINFFRREDAYYNIAGSVWEYYSNSFFNHNYTRVNFEKISKSNDDLELDFFTEPVFAGLIKEIKLDIDNGIFGKTVIHPGHVLIVNSSLAVSREDYEDALSIINNVDGGAYSSTLNVRMNEPKPHLNWAKKLIIRSKVYGVLNYGYDYKSIIRE